MNPYSSKRWTILSVILTLLFVSTACNPPQPGAPVATATATPQSGDKTFDATGVFGSGPFDLQGTTVGLADLSSYKATLTLAFDGTNAGQPSKWSKTYVMLTMQKPAARQLTIEKTGDLPDLTPVLMAEADGASYKSRGEKTCTANAIVEGNSLAARMEPAGFLTGILGADAAGSETVNGVKAGHYTFDENALGQVNLAKSAGEMWVASDGGYIVKYLLTTKATAAYFGEGIEGTLTWDYELTGVGKPVTFKLPADCPPGLVNAPQLPDATNVESVPGLLSFDTSTSIADAAAFYEKQLPTLGWKPLGEPAIKDTSALLDFTQKSKTLTVVITTDAGITSVDIAAGAVKP